MLQSVLLVVLGLWQETFVSHRVRSAVDIVCKYIGMRNVDTAQSGFMQLCRACLLPGLTPSPWTLRPHSLFYI